MGKIALLVSREEMLHQAHNILQEKKYEISEMRVIKTEDAVSEARRSIGAGASIIIARGLQASLMKQYTDIPVVEIVITAQEMALLVNKAKEILKNETPVIGVVGFRNMFCDMSYFDLIYGIEMRTYFADKSHLLEDMTRQAISDEVDLIIGGDTAVNIAGEAGLPSLFLSNTEDSLRNALSMAESMDYAMGIEKRNAAQIETLLDHSFSGVVRLDASGIILDLNPMMEDILQMKKEEVLLKAASEIFPELLKDFGTEPYSLFMEINRTSVFAVVAPVVIDQRTEGVILTCHRMKKRRSLEPDSRGKSHAKCFIALGEFDDILQESQAMQECIRLAKLYALSEKTVLIEGEAGTEKRLLAQSIHNAGLQKDGPFVALSCDGIGDDGQSDMIFGDKGAAAQAKGGSLLLEEVQCLTRANQYRLCQLIRYKSRIGKDGVRDSGTDVRVMVTTDVPLSELADDGIMREDLYYLLSGLTVRIPPLRERKEDLERKLTESIRGCCEHYSRFHVLTHGARKLLHNYPWEGNLLQVESFCERLILTANKRSIDEGFAELVIKELYPRSHNPEKEKEQEERTREKPVSEEAKKIAVTLLRFGGNQEETAKALGISKTTLWRKRKKYHLK
ncbi:PrpR N-terminal domain-containing protein [Lacrimispora sp.]|uniref:PrpR N-terminal domain-containing protein n=1 Tax=Lacrimispora sp. TaxID=2719234 RepID=UPI00289F6AF1|nr:PrpR N-terminal domain-containing protein [Lacrimispora sp.]